MRKCLAVLVLALSTTVLEAQESWFYRNYKDPVSVEFYSPEITIYDPTPPALRQAGHRTTLQLPDGDVATATTLSDGWTYVDLSAPAGSDPVAYALSVIDAYATDPGDDVFATPMFGTLEFRRFSGPEIHVGFGFDVPRATVDAVLLAAGLDTVLEEDWIRPNIFRVTGPIRSGVDLLDVANALAMDPDVRYAVPAWSYTGSDFQEPVVVEAPPAPVGPLWTPPFLDTPAQALAEGCLGIDPIPPDDSLWFASWHLEQAFSAVDMDAVQGWSVCTGEDPGEGPEDEVAKLYLLDTGIQVDHPDLAGRLLPGKSFTSDCAVGGAPNCEGQIRELRCVSNAHMTAVASVAAAVANNALGSLGLAPNLKIVPLRIGWYEYIENTGACEVRYDTTSIASAIKYVAAVGGRVSSMSWNFGFLPEPDFEEAYEVAAEAGVMSFNSAGNNHQNRVAVPGDLPTVHAISAVDSTGARMFVRSGWGSNIGDDVAFSGPGRYIPTTDVTGDFGFSEVETIPNYGNHFVSVTGTSYACPLVAVVAAVTFILQPSWGPDEVFEAMKKCAKDLGDPGWDPVNGFGLATAGCTWEYAASFVFSDGFESGTTSKWTFVSGGTP